MGNLERFRTAQDAANAGFETALAEIRAGGKRSHWIWYIFPQLAGLGMSNASQFFAIADRQEAIAYLRDEQLRTRLLTITRAVAEQLRARVGPSVEMLMGSDTDARKLVSSLTLFAPLARALSTQERSADYAALADAADEVLRLADAEGYPACAHTLRQTRAGGLP
jgi:uncharacterized protein (DUF1810 family)